MKLKPIGERVVLKQIERSEERTKKGIYLPKPEDKKEGIVVEVGTLKDGQSIPLQKGDKVLYGGYSSDEFERWAQHLDSAEVIAYADSLGLTTVVNEPDVFYSRMGFPLNGRVFGFEKGPRFKVHPVFKGMTHEERKRMSGVI